MRQGDELTRRLLLKLETQNSFFNIFCAFCVFCVDYFFSHGILRTH